MTPPLDKARGLMALSEKATPGTWFHCQPFQRVEKNRTVHGSVAGQWVDFISTEPAPVHRRIVVPMHDAESNNRVTSEDMAFIAAACNFARTDLPALLAEVERLRWRPIETAPEGRPVLLGWMERDYDGSYSERYDFDLIEDGCWARYEDHYQLAHSVAVPEGTQMPPEAPPYQFWMDIRPFPTAPAKEAQS